MCQIKWFLKLSQISEVREVPDLSDDAQSYLQRIIDDFSIGDALEIKRIQKTDPDGALEYFLRQKCSSHPEISKVDTSVIRLLVLKQVFFSVL